MGRWPMFKSQMDHFLVRTPWESHHMENMLTIPKTNECFLSTNQNDDSYKWLSIVYGPIVSVQYTASVFIVIFWSFSHSLLEKMEW